MSGRSPTPKDDIAQVTGTGPIPDGDSVRKTDIRGRSPCAEKIAKEQRDLEGLVEGFKVPTATSAPKPGGGGGTHFPPFSPNMNY